MSPLEIEVVEGILEEGDILSDNAYIKEIIVEHIIVRYGTETFEIVKHDNEIVHIIRLI